MLGAFVLGSMWGFQEQSPEQVRLLSRLDEAVRLRRHGERSLGYGHLRRGVRAPRSDGFARGIPAGLEGNEFGLLTRRCTGYPPRFSGWYHRFVSAARSTPLGVPHTVVCPCARIILSCVCAVLLSNVRSDPSACLWSACGKYILHPFASVYFAATHSR
jgi:hypothetical protein